MDGMISNIVSKTRAIAASIVCAALLSVPARAQTTSFTATYKGQGSFGTCGTTYNISGREPSAGGKFPVFAYMVGTSESYTNASAMAAVGGMANRGYVAATIQYNSGSFGNCSQISAKARCIFNPSSTSSAITKLCSRAKADCSKGIVAGGFSQGSVIATLAKNFDSRLQAAWGMGTGVRYSTYDLTSCMADGNRTLPSSRLRVINGEVDEFLGGNANAVRDQCQKLTGFSCGSTAFSCLQSNGSGWYIVRGTEVQDGTAEHCYMRVGGCSLFPDNQDKLDQNWLNGTGAWSLNPNLDWLTGFTAH
jgi:hypothetical protein